MADTDAHLKCLLEAQDSLREAIHQLEKASEHAPQPAVIDDDGVYRFRVNPIVSDLLDSHPTEDMNTIVRKDYERADRAQFLQLIGYSISGAYMQSDAHVDGAQQSAELLAFARDIATSFDHEHPSKGQVRKGECAGAPQCRACSALRVLEKSESPTPKKTS